MVKKEDKLKLICITLILDSLFVYILKLSENSLKDVCFLATALASHLVFYYGLISNDRRTLDILHYGVFVLLSASMSVDSVYIKKVCLLLLFGIKYLWYQEGRCILNEENEIFGYGDEAEQFVNTTIPALIGQIGAHYQIKEWFIDGALSFL
tara:strand:- start:1007 stop:1462 length:456 start_codon:yes stop_codon:yes gene_type:complete